MRRVWRVLRWILLALVLLAGAVLAVNLVDDRIDPGAKAMLDAPAEAVPREQNLYYFVLGLGTAGSDPGQAGWDQVQVVRAQLDAGVSPSDLAPAEEPSLKFIGNRERLPALGDFKGSLDLVRRYPDEVAQMLADNQRILEHYELLYAFPRYVDPVPVAASSLALMPQWGLVSYGKRLWTLKLAQGLARGGPETVIAWLERDNRFWRRLIAEEGTGLLGKMVMSTELRVDFQISSQLVHLAALDSMQLDTLRQVGAPLSPRERGLKGVWKSEFQWNVALLSHDFDKKVVAERSRNWRERLYFQFQALFYLPNATINRRYRYVLDYSKMDGDDCTKMAADQSRIINSGNIAEMPWKLVRNPLGVILVGISGPSYIDYPMRMCDLEGLQRLLALQILLRQRNPADADVPAFIKNAGAQYADPYTGAPMQWLPEQRALSFHAYNKRERELLPWPI